MDFSLIISTLDTELLRKLALAFGVIFFMYLIFSVIITLILSRLTKLAMRTKTDLDDLVIKFIQDLKWSIFVLITIIILLKILGFPVLLIPFSGQIIIIAIIYVLIKAGTTIINFIIQKITKTYHSHGGSGNPYLIWGNIAKYLVYAGGLLIIIANLGYDINAFIAGLGIGGLAIALALKNILADIFASLTIQLNKPFVIGDYIKVGSQAGTVVSTGLKSTHLLSLDQETIIIPNNTLINSDIINLTGRRKYRNRFILGITYETDNTKLKTIPKLLEIILSKYDEVQINRIIFKSYGDFALNFEVYMYIKADSYGDFAQLRSQINYDIFEAFAQAKIDFAYPTQTVFIKKD